MARPVPPVVRGRCPGVFDPLLTGDGWLVRLHCPGGVVTPAALCVLAELAASNGSGQIELTSRANLQLRGLREDVLEATGRELVAAGLAARDAASDGWRAVVTSPLAGHDPASLVDTAPLVAALAAELAAELDGPPPAKFGVVVDDGGTWPLDGLDADVHLAPLAVGGWAVALRGEGWVGTVDHPLTTVVAAARLCAAERRRIDGVVDEHGLGSVLGALVVTPARPATLEPGPGPARAIRDDRPGVRDHRDPDRCSLLAAPFLGRLDARTLGALAGLAEQDELDVRLTTARSVAFCRIRRARLARIRDDLEGLGLLTTSTDPRGRVSACVGSRGCDAARADTWAEAERLAEAGSGRVHLSGCDKGCGAPRGVIHLVAVDRTRFVERTVTA